MVVALATAVTGDEAADLPAGDRGHHTGLRRRPGAPADRGHRRPRRGLRGVPGGRRGSDPDDPPRRGRPSSTSSRASRSTCRRERSSNPATPRSRSPPARSRPSTTSTPAPTRSRSSTGSRSRVVAARSYTWSFVTTVYRRQLARSRGARRRRPPRRSARRPSRPWSPCWRPGRRRRRGRTSSRSTLPGLLPPRATIAASASSRVYPSSVPDTTTDLPASTCGAFGVRGTGTPKSTPAARSFSMNALFGSRREPGRDRRGDDRAEPLDVGQLARPARHDRVERAELGGQRLRRRRAEVLDAERRQQARAAAGCRDPSIAASRLSALIAAKPSRPSSCSWVRP